MKRVVHWIAGVAVLIILGVAVWRCGAQAWALARDRVALQAWIASFGAWAPLVGIALSAAQVIAAPVPGQVIGLANGYLFGVWWGTV